MNPVVTIGVCVRNCESCIRECIRSIADQSFPHELMEIVIVDDGSEDQTLSVIRSMTSTLDIPVRVFHSPWKGLGAARNKIVNNADGDYIVWVDGDMILPKDFVEKQVRFMERNPCVGIAKGRFGMSSGESLVAMLENVTFLVVHHNQEGKAISSLPGTGGAIYRLKAIKQAGGFDEDIRGAGEDMVAAHKVSEAGWPIYITSATFYEKPKEKWNALWSKYFSYGYSIHYVLHRHKGLERPVEMLPPVAFLDGVAYAVTAYKLTREKLVLLLPLQFVFKMTAWCLGFAKSHISSYGHRRG